MAEDITAGGDVRRTPIHLWIIGVLALLWNAMGAFDYLASQLNLEFYMSQFSEQQLAYFNSFPTWLVAFWAFGVWGAFVGTIFLLLRKSWAIWAYAVSILGMFVTSIYNFGMTNGLEVMGTSGLIFTIVIWVIAIALLVYAIWLSKKGVLS
jgi:hypothetical protein